IAGPFARDRRPIGDRARAKCRNLRSECQADPSTSMNDAVPDEPDYLEDLKVTRGHSSASRLEQGTVHVGGVHLVGGQQLPTTHDRNALSTEPRQASADEVLVR